MSDTPVADTTTPTQSISPWYSDKGLYVMVLGVLLPFISKLVGFQLDPEKVALMLIPIVTFIIGHKWKSGAVLVAEIKARATQAVALTTFPNTPRGAADALNSLMVPAPK